jgi:hypothetical protein
MPLLEAAELLMLWERGALRHALDRSALLCACARPGLAAQTLADLPLGEVTAALLRLREAQFGSRIDCHLDCTACGQRLELALRTHELLQPAGATAAATVEAAGLELRAPTLRDLAAVAHERDAARAARTLLQRCTLRGDAQALDAAALREVEEGLEALDPNADLAFSVHCAACGQESTAQLDAGVLLWDEIDAHARALLAEVHALAAAYGWSEAQILALSPARRATYLSLVDA